MKMKWLLLLLHAILGPVYMWGGMEHFLGQSILYLRFMWILYSQVNFRRNPQIAARPCLFKMVACHFEQARRCSDLKVKCLYEKNIWMMLKVRSCPKWDPAQSEILPKVRSCPKWDPAQVRQDRKLIVIWTLTKNIIELSAGQNPDNCPASATTCPVSANYQSSLS